MVQGQFEGHQQGTPTGVYYNQIERRKMDEAGQEKIEKFPIMKTYSVFNLEQVDGASLDHLRPGNSDVSEVLPDFDYADEALRATNADIWHGEGQQPHGQGP